MGDRGRHEIDLASRKAEEAALRRYQAIHWLDYLEGPLGIPSQASEREFLACLRNGLILCNVMNKVKPGSVPKIVDNHLPSQSIIWDSQPLPAFQYFENIRNFLVAVEELKLPAFEASVFNRDNIEAGSSTKVVDCILALKAYNEWRQLTGGNGIYKPPRSPLAISSVGRINARAPVVVNSDSRRRLDMSVGSQKELTAEVDAKNLEGLIVKCLAERMVDMKENVNDDIFTSFNRGSVNPIDLFSKILSCCVEEKLQNKAPQQLNPDLSNCCDETRNPQAPSTYTPLQELTIPGNQKVCRACLGKGKCTHWNQITVHEKELLNLKVLLSSAKRELKDLQCQLQSDLKLLADQVLEISTSALGYKKLVKENRNLYNMVQDLKGSIRVYCRIRPSFLADAKTAIDFIGEDGSLVVVDPFKPYKDGRKSFQFNRVFGPTATQEEVFVDIKPLIRSVMDGYNVCIFAYGQTGSGKTYTMSGPSVRSMKELGINQLALNDLFHLSYQRKGIMNYNISVQMVEIYNEQIRDLLAEDLSTTKLEIRSCVSDTGLVLPDATLLPVTSSEDVLSLMQLGEVNRAVGCTAMNTRSSRSHSVLIVHVHGEDTSGNKLRSCLNLVDLAGSERVDKSEVTGDGLKEAQYINKSLSCLGDVITALALKNSHIPYRNSKLTLLLQNSLGGQAKMLMFAHVSPEEESFGESLSTLKFAQRASSVELGAARSNKESSEVIELKAQVESLKKALANRGAVASQAMKPPKEARTPPPPLQKARAGNERTTPQTRRLSTENVEKTTPLVVSTRPRSRRLSLEGPRGVGAPPRSPIGGGSSPSAVKNHVTPPRSPIRSAAKNQLTPPRTSPVSVSAFNIQLPPRSPTSSASNILFAHPRSPTSAALKNRGAKAATQLPKTPEPAVGSSRNEASSRGILTECTVSSSLQTPALTVRKTSQIRKSLRTTIGKLINGSDKRSHRSKMEETAAVSPLKAAIRSSLKDAKSPLAASSAARTLRRQSLTGILPPENSRRSSLGWK
ncbi:PREDICTED: kinesin-like protein KIN-14L isoform X2 [Ipomoea nil]|uniref:kinesin-like protein KIN-14L isoform X2 n=1 Tax=Ipomoea nil TaxID=35883 RepID=UPI000900B663|nr:PREDICTED: kinesin-like protein KIN-14L isoform X2 [Ipomoea nil]